jgi:hypothetical protein
MYPVQLSIDHKDFYYYMWKIKMYEGNKIEVSAKSNDKNVILACGYFSSEYYTGLL